MSKRRIRPRTANGSGRWGFDPRQEPCPVTGCPPLASRAATLVSIVVFQTGVSRTSTAALEYEVGSRPGPDLWHKAATRRTSRHQPPPGRTSHRARDRCPNGGRLPGRLQSGRPEPGPGSAGMCHFSVHQCSSRQPKLSPVQPEISALDCQKNIAYFLTHDDDIRLRSRSGHEACPRKRTRQRVHAARLP